MLTFLCSRSPLIPLLTKIWLIQSLVVILFNCAWCHQTDVISGVAHVFKLPFVCCGKHERSEEIKQSKHESRSLIP